MQQCKNFNPKLNVYVPHINQDEVKQSRDAKSIKYDAQQQYLKLQQYHTPRVTQERFKWTQDPSDWFALVITLIGVSTAKPRKLFELFPKSFNLTTVALGSHLQKYKLKIQREFHLESFD